MAASNERCLGKDWEKSLTAVQGLMCENLRPDTIINSMVSEGLMSMEDMEELHALATCSQKARMLYRMILNGTEDDVRTFRDALVKTCQHHLARLLSDSVAKHTGVQL